MTSRKTMKSAFESMMFVWGQPLEAKQAGEVFHISKAEAYAIFKELQDEYEYEQRGIRIREVGGAFQFVTEAENAEYIEQLCSPVKLKKLSQSALEVLAIVAYRQPITRAEIESIRGTRSDKVIDGLKDKALIYEKGRSHAIGRPILYGTTDRFLKQFGFETIKDLPPIEDIESAIYAGDSDDGPLAEQIEIEI